MERLLALLILLTSGYGVSAQTPVNCSAVTARVHAEIQINKTWNQDLTNTSSAAYLDQKNKLETAVESVLGADVCLEDVSFSNGTVIAKFCVGFVEAVGASPTIFVHNLTSAIQSGSVGNLTVNSTSFEVVGNCTAVVGQTTVASPSPVIASPSTTLAAASNATPVSSSAAAVAAPVSSSAAVAASNSAAAPDQDTSQTTAIAPSPTAVVVTSSSAGPITTKVVSRYQAKIQMKNRNFTSDLTNKSSEAYKKLTKELEEGVQSALKNDEAKIEEATYESGSVIANITVKIEELVAAGSVPTNYFEEFKKAIESGAVGNFTVNNTYIFIVEKFEDGITLTIWNVNTDECQSSCCKDGILNLEIEETRTCSGDTQKCTSVPKKRKILCENSPCKLKDYCNSAGVSLHVYSSMFGLLTALLVFVMTG